jgi:hypothetical protein
MWFHVVGEAVIVATTDQVREIARRYWKYPSCRRECKRGSNPTKGVCLPMGDFIHLLAHGLPDEHQLPLDGD